jgi:uridine phosphorylase
MQYPQYRNKHLEDSLFDAKNFITYLYKQKNYPKKYIIIFQRHSERYIKRQYALKKDKDGSKAGNMYIYKDIGFFKMTGIGSPHAVTALEELIALGGKEFIIIGTAGGFQDYGLVVCDKAIRDEGTSYHYISDGKYSYPNKALTDRYIRILKHKKIPYIIGTSWTIDAPYRETKAEIDKYKKEGVWTVEMEASAMFATCYVRRVKIAAAFSVSDIIGKEEWEPSFHKKAVKQGLITLIDAAVKCFSK